MRKNALIICCTTFVFGAFGAFFRWLQNMTAFEADTGLYISGNTWGLALTICAIAFAAVLLVWVLRLKNLRLTLPEDATLALAGTTVLYKPLAILFSALMAGGGVLLMFSASEDKYPLLQIALSVLAVFGGAGFFLITSVTWKKRIPPLNCFGSVLLLVQFFVWLIVSYRENTSTSIVWKYAMEVLGLSCSLLAYQYIAGIPFGRAKPGRTVYFSQLAAFLCAVALPDSRYLGQQVMLLANIGMLILISWVIIANHREDVSVDVVPDGDAFSGRPEAEFEPEPSEGVDSTASSGQ